MHNDLKDLPEEELLQWIELSIRNKENILGEGYHGAAYLYDGHGLHLVVKTPLGSGVLRWFRLIQLRQEYEVYLKLAGIEGVPACYGLLQGQYLLLEYIDGESLRTAEVNDHQHYMQRYLQLIKNIHLRDVAHGDMKRKENLLVVDGKEPCIIDFGVAVIRKNGFHPLNRYLFNLAKTIDYNAWVKHKYRRDYANISEEDRQYLNDTVTERVSRWVKRTIFPFIRKT